MNQKFTAFSRSEIQELFKSARTLCKTEFLDIKATRSDLDTGRLLIITPKKLGNAPTRNLIRRRLKALFYEERLYEKKYDFIFFCRPDITKLEFSELKKIVVDCLAKLHNPGKV